MTARRLVACLMLVAVLVGCGDDDQSGNHPTAKEPDLIPLVVIERPTMAIRFGENTAYVSLWCRDDGTGMYTRGEYLVSDALMAVVPNDPACPQKGDA